MTLTMTGEAPIIRATLASLQNGLPAQIAAFNNDTTNGVVLTEPAQYVFGAVSPRVDPFPICEVAIREGDLWLSDLGARNLDSDPMLVVAITDEGERGDLSLTYEKSLGLKKCATEVLFQDGAFGNNVDRIDPVAGSGDRLHWALDALPVDWYADTSQPSGRNFRKYHMTLVLTVTLAARDGLA